MTTFFGRVYKVEILADGGALRTIDGFPAEGREPAQVTFMVDQTPNAERSYAEIVVFGLNRDSRSAIYNRGDQVRLTAGYEESWSVVFDGQVNNVEIGREREDSFVKLFCMSGVDAWDAHVDRKWGRNTPYRKILEDVAGTFGFPVEFVGDFSEFPKALKGKTIDRSAPSAMRMLEKSLEKMDKGYGFSWMIENDTVVIARETAERINAEDWRYTAVTGLIGPPEITAQGVDITVLLNPRLRPRDTFRVEATNQQLTFNGIYYQGQEFASVNGQGRNQALAIKHEGDFYGDVWETQVQGQLVDDA